MLEGCRLYFICVQNKSVKTIPGGLFGRISIDFLGKKKYDARNPNIISILEDMEIIENRGSGIATMIDEMQHHGLKALVFEDIRELCCNIFWNE